MKQNAPSVVLLGTPLGDIEIALYLDQAPQSCRAFLQFVEDGRLAEQGTFFRVVRGAQNDQGHPPIEVVQGGLQHPSSALATFAHEATRQSGLHHRDCTLSLARRAIGTTTGATFFICIGDQPSLDFGGGRDPFQDGQGFAAFGRVRSGMQTVHRIYQLPTSPTLGEPYVRGQLLERPVRIERASRRQ